MVISDEIFDRCWFFIRGDTSAQEFESWVYKTTELQHLFGDDFYMNLISTDYSSTGSVNGGVKVVHCSGGILPSRAV